MGPGRCHLPEDTFVRGSMGRNRARAKHSIQVSPSLLTKLVWWREDTVGGS